MKKIKIPSFKLLFTNLILLTGIILFITLFTRIFGQSNSSVGAGIAFIVNKVLYDRFTDREENQLLNA